MDAARLRNNNFWENFTLFYFIYLTVLFIVKIGRTAKKIVLAPFISLATILNISLRFIKASVTLPFHWASVWHVRRGRGRPKKNRIILWFKIVPLRTIIWLIGLLSRVVKFVPLFFYKVLFFWKKPKVGRPHKKHFFLTARPYSLSAKLSYLFLGSLFTLLVLFIYQSYLFTKNLPSPYSIGKVNYPLSSHIYDRKGRLLYEFFREQNRTPVHLETLPAYVAQAAIAIEDKDFYHHKGISVISGILRATREIVVNKNLQGGSTITQQLVKSALLTPERTIQRKIKEIILALWTEQVYSKNQILEMYLNQVPYGGSSYGIEEASKTYFGKSAKNLTVEEAAMLAGLPQAPSLYSPYVNPDYALRRRNDVITKMYEQGYIDKTTKDKALKSKLHVNPLNTQIKAPHFVFYVKSELEKMYGIRQVEEGGFNITTTLDLDVQQEAEKILREELAKVANLNVTNGAILVTKPATGEILAMVGSVDYFANSTGAYNVTTALRQPGSSIKPIMYSLALEKGYTAATLIDDSPVVFTIAGSESYKPVNYDGRYHGKVTLRYALANSYNIPAVKVLSTVGIRDFAQHAKVMGISTWTDENRYGLSMTLGGLEVTMLDMATAFGVFANEGYKTDLNYILKLENSKGELLSSLSPNREKVIDEGVAYIISDILSDNAARVPAFGPKSFLEIPGFKVAVKTGTTDDKKDNWTNGYTPEFEVVVWVGNNNNQPMNPYLTSGITGAAPIWNRTMSYVLNTYGHKDIWLTRPANIVEKNCLNTKNEVFVAGTENVANCKDMPPSITPKSEASR